MTAQIIQFSATKEDKEVFCNFCKKKYKTKEVKVVDNGNGKAICEHCVKRCKEILKENET